ncbi:MAG: ABC transporter ATP-binding protein [Smithella sp.]|nr:ABC transporter ATP-binding protein [Smithella sp.]HQG65868.1 ABC transporter ATP-binding protein [Smithella sp.]HQH17309.1 ABC transporter ATP-binding protein [Smithella sp.]HQI71699.1 ABC transporter ATP-binding protein [Smithella sp.]
MTHIRMNNVCVDFPIYNTTGRSLKNQLMQAATGGRMGSNEQGRVVVRALQSISLEFKEGDRVGVVGRNGAGKSTLLRVISGVYEPIEGFLEVQGKITSMIDLSLGMDGEATGVENIYLRGALLGFHRQWLSSKISDIVDFAGLGDFIRMPLRTYSTGMQMRLAFSIATLVQPEILLMDEWLTVGDADFKEKAQQRLHEIVQKSSILIIATHSPELVKTICNRTVRLDRGAVIAM